MRGDRSTYNQIVSTGFKCFARSHRSLLIARLGPGRSNPGDNNFDLVTEFTTKRCDFVRTGYNSIDSCFNAYLCQAQHLIIDFRRNSNFPQRFFC